MTRDSSYTAHLPRFVLSRLERSSPGALSGCPEPRRVATMFCDISGFTPLSETLARQGKPGTEELTVQLNDYFERLLGVVGSWGGDTVKFGGDAVTVLFDAGEGEGMEGPLRRASAAAREVFEVLGVVRTARTPWGDFPLSLKIGISAGVVLTGIIGAEGERTEPVVAGDALDRMAEAEHHARPGDVVVDLLAEGAGAAGLEAEPLEGGFGRLLGLRGHVPKPPGLSAPHPPPDRVRPFLLPAVWGQIQAGSEAMLGEHRPVVTVFVAFPGLDYSSPESLPKLDDYFRRVYASMKGFGGSFNRMDMGDKGSKFLGFFGAPESYEDNAERAVAFALALREIEREVPWASGQRVGLSLGTNFCGMMGSEARREYTVMGDAVNVAARLMGAAQPGEALAMREIRTATRARFQWGPYRALTLKGKSAPIQVSTPRGAIRSPQVHASKAPVTLVGRTEESALLRKARARAGKGPVPFVVLRGESGIGKTTLLQAALAEAAGQGWRTALGTCQSVGAAPLQAWSDIFRTLLVGGRGDRDSLEARLRELLPDQLEFLGLALRFLGFSAPLSPAAESLEPKERFEKTADLLARALTQMAREQPVAVGLDGLSHAEDATKDLLSGVTARLQRARVVFFGASRAGLELPGSPKDIPLGGLGSAEIRQLAAALLDATRITDALADFLAERTGGNPLFLIELLQNLKERGAVEKDREGRVQFHPGNVGDTPGNIEGLLLARIDRLPLVTRNVLKVAACLGNHFDLDLLQSVFLPRMSAGELSGHLDVVAELGLVPGGSPGEEGFTFLHSSLRDAAYNAVLLANRRSIHRSAAECLEARNRQADASLIAFHFGQAEVWDRALEFGLKAGFAASERYAFKEAAQLFGEALAYGQKCGKPIGAKERVLMAEAFLQAGQPQQSHELLDALLKEGLDAEDRLRAGEAYLRLLESRDQHAACIDMAKSLILEARGLGKAPQEFRASRYMVSSLFRLSRQEEALEEIQRIKERLLEEGEDRSSFDILEGALLLQRGKVKEAAEHYRAALTWARQSQHLPLQLRSAIGMSNALKGGGQLPASFEYAQEALVLARKVGSRFNLLGATVTCSSALNLMGKYEDAAHLLEENLAIALQGEFPYAASSYLNEVGVTRYFQSRFKDAIRYYRASGRIARKIGNFQQVAHVEYNIADAQNAMGDVEAAERQYRRALTSFRKSQNVPWFGTAAREALAMLAAGEHAPRREAFLEFVQRELRLWKRLDLLPAITA